MIAFVGIGATRGAPAAEIGALVDAALAEAGLPPAAVRCAATLDAKRAEPGVLTAVGERGWELVAYSAATLAAVQVPRPSAFVQARTGAPSVAEAAALHAARTLGGGPAELVVGKRRSAHATVAVARMTEP
jgi:cobalt-precorrin 5A hydrolase / precorrin-3B C17-methyltransferase